MSNVMSNAGSPAESRPWYKEPWPWILMAGPALAIVGCMITIYLAMTRFADEPIYDGGVRRGLVVERVHAAPVDVPPGAIDSQASEGGAQASR